MFLAIGICLCVSASVGFIAAQLNKAPIGWEDETGLHVLATGQSRTSPSTVGGTLQSAVVRKRRQLEAAAPLLAFRRGNATLAR